jgi:hypothetical protein
MLTLDIKRLSNSTAAGKFQEDLGWASHLSHSLIVCSVMSLDVLHKCVNAAVWLQANLIQHTHYTCRLVANNKSRSGCVEHLAVAEEDEK